MGNKIFLGRTPGPLAGTGTGLGSGVHSAGVHLLGLHLGFWSGARDISRLWSGARAISRLWSGARAISLFLLILLFWAEVKEIAAVSLGLGSESTSGLDCGAAGISGLRTGRDLRVGDGHIERCADRCKSWIHPFGSQVHPSALGCPPTGTGRHRRIRVVGAIGQECGGCRPGVSWRSPVVLRMALIFSYFYLKVRAI